MGLPKSGRAQRQGVPGGEGGGGGRWKMGHPKSGRAQGRVYQEENKYKNINIKN